MLSPFLKKILFIKSTSSLNRIVRALRACKKQTVPSCRKNNFSFISLFFPKKIELEFNFKIWDVAKHSCPFILLNFLLYSVFFQWWLCQQISVVLVLSTRKFFFFFFSFFGFCIVFWSFNIVNAVSIFSMLKDKCWHLEYYSYSTRR